MSEENALTTLDYPPRRELGLQELEDAFAVAVRQRELLEDYIKHRLKPDKHYYKVSNDQKPSLTKEGAELICLPHNLKPVYEFIAGPTNPPADNSRYQITVKCRLLRGGQPDNFQGEGIGSANSHVTKRDGTIAPRQKDIGLRHNATLKMAQKSAYIAATLNATAASEFYTQDLEEVGADLDANGHEHEGEAKGEYWCEKHQTYWFKKGKMKGYAHPLDDGAWCDMAKEKERESKPNRPQVDPGEIDDFWKYCKAKGFEAPVVLDLLGVRQMKDWLAEHTLAEARERIDAELARDQQGTKLL